MVVSLFWVGWMAWANLIMSQAPEQNLVLSIFRECSSERLDLTPVISSRSARYKLPSNALNFFALPRAERERLLVEFEAGYRDDFFARSLASILREIGMKPLSVVESDVKDDSRFRYFFITEK
ncbi:hypothetical protein [Roseimicrobium sp. ORNL1]|uniref:hypothetical protein n=1 Tax=Roseimicrobium sp. ORNL1 TaxID=2711231 RepID=UPI00197FF34E|nr:hypothetical protein [Roseimicrobium sp. ORNL1]